MDDPTTHHPECYREHHACAVARLDRLREVMTGLRPEVLLALMKSPVPHWTAHDLLVAVRDITEGR